MKEAGGKVPTRELLSLSDLIIYQLVFVLNPRSY